MIQVLAFILIWVSCMTASFFYGAEINQMENDKFVAIAKERLGKCHKVITRNDSHE